MARKTTTSNSEPIEANTPASEPINKKESVLGVYNCLISCQVLRGKRVITVTAGEKITLSIEDQYNASFFERD